MVEETDPDKQKAASEKIFKTMDVNHDGAINKKEMMALVNAFWKEIPKEMLSMMKKFGIKEGDAKDQMAEAIFADADENADGKVTFEEWHKAITAGSMMQNMKTGM